jgi:hypothetical protein
LLSPGCVVAAGGFAFARRRSMVPSKTIGIAAAVPAGLIGDPGWPRLA